jgi:hypothetical protein
MTSSKLRTRYIFLGQDVSFREPKIKVFSAKKKIPSKLVKNTLEKLQQSIMKIKIGSAKKNRLSQNSSRRWRKKKLFSSRDLFRETRAVPVAWRTGSEQSWKIVSGFLNSPRTPQAAKKKLNNKEEISPLGVSQVKPK